MASSKGSDPNKTTRYITPTGKVPLLSAVDDEVDWTMVAIELRALLKRFEGYEEALFETQLVEVNARAEAKEKTWKEQCVEYFLLLSGGDVYSEQNCNAASPRACNH